MKCPNCQSDMKLIPAGVSKKTGKPYNAFYSCTSPNCKTTSNAGGEETRSKQDRIDQAVAQKRENIKWLNAVNNATQLICHGKSEKALKDLALEIYEMEQPQESLKDKLERGFGERVIEVEDINF